MPIKRTIIQPGKAPNLPKRNLSSTSKKKKTRSFKSDDEMEQYYQIKLSLAKTEKERRDANAGIKLARICKRLFSNDHYTAIHREGGTISAKEPH